MSDLIRMDDAQLAAILNLTYPIWNEGLSLAGYHRWNIVQMRTPWGAKHLRRVALVEAGSILASAKWYDLDTRFDGRPLRVLGIGAVFTPESERGRGHAPELIRRMMADAEREGYHAAMLFSEIGAPYYERLGFTVIHRDTLTLDVIQKKGAPATLVRAGNDADLTYLAAIHDTSPFDSPLRGSLRPGDAVARFSVRRTQELIQFAVSKRRTQSALAPLGARTTEFYVAEEGNHAVAYVLLSRGPAGNLADGPDTMWLEACGDRDPTGARVGAMLQVLFARTPAETPPPLSAWLPDGWLPPQVRIASRAPAEDVMMIKPLGSTVIAGLGEQPGLRGSDVIWWHADYF